LLKPRNSKAKGNYGGDWEHRSNRSDWNERTIMAILNSDLQVSAFSDSSASSLDPKPPCWHAADLTPAD